MPEPDTQSGAAAFEGDEDSSSSPAIRANLADEAGPGERVHGQTHDVQHCRLPVHTCQ
jgi:hypothetical protein